MAGTHSHIPWNQLKKNVSGVTATSVPQGGRAPSTSRLPSFSLGTLVSPEQQRYNRTVNLPPTPFPQPAQVDHVPLLRLFILQIHPGDLPCVLRAGRQTLVDKLIPTHGGRTMRETRVLSDEEREQLPQLREPRWGGGGRQMEYLWGRACFPGISGGTNNWTHTEGNLGNEAGLRGWKMTKAGRYKAKIRGRSIFRQPQLSFLPRRMTCWWSVVLRWCSQGYVTFFHSQWEERP